MNTPPFQSFEQAETTIRNQILDLCNNYSDAIKKILPTLNKAKKNQNLSTKDKKQCLDLYEEGNDHLHNLVQLKLELNDLEELNQNLLLDISSEVLANVVKYLESLPNSLKQTDILTE